ncbi:MAG: 3-phosphoshikimate 1-carboxyvinyltransferase [Candidatus Bruticola sp.]
MTDLLLIDNQSKKPFRGRFFVPGDKSIGQRALILAAMAEGDSIVSGISDAADCLSVVKVLRRLGAVIEIKGKNAHVTGWGDKGPAIVNEPLDCGNSGACMRFISGILAVSSGIYTLIGDESLSQRPMDKLADVLEKFGAKVECLGVKNCAPLRITGCFHPDNKEWAAQHSAVENCSLEIETNNASAQLKTAAMLAALSLGGSFKLTLTEPLKSRDHSEIMLRKLGFKVNEENLPDGRHRVIFSVLGSRIKPFQYCVFGDPSSAAFLVALAVMKPHSHIVIDRLVINPTRVGFFNILKRMNANICARFSNYSYGEMIGGITADYSHLKGVEVRPKDIPLCIDEIPLLAIIASRSQGVTKVRGAYQLRQKESDRISMTLRELKKLGIESQEYDDGFDIVGLPEYKLDMKVRQSKNKTDKIEPIRLDAHGDHRLAMSLGVAACVYRRPIEIVGAELCAVSFPDFWNILKAVSAF